MKKKGNISILVIFVLLASSLLGILSMNFVQQMMKQSAVVTSYYKSYYLAKAGIELGLVQISHRGIGFEYVVSTGESLVMDNFLCRPNCSLATTISGTATLLSKNFWQGSGCEYPYLLSGGNSLIVPLFRDIYVGNVAGTFSSSIEYQNLADTFKQEKIQIKNISSPDSVIFGLLILSGQEFSDNGVFFASGSLQTSSLIDFKNHFESYMSDIDRSFANDYGSARLLQQGYTMYLMFSNTAQTQQSFCLTTASDDPLQVATQLPTDTFFLQSTSSYGNQIVALNASYAQPIPGFLFSSYSSY